MAEDTQTPTILVRPSEAMRLLQIGKGTYYGLVAKGQLRTVKIGQVARVPRAAIDELIASLPSGSETEETDRGTA